MAEDEELERADLHSDLRDFRKATTQSFNAMRADLVDRGDPRPD